MKFGLAASILSLALSGAVSTLAPPILRYEFDDMTESMTGDSKYTLFKPSSYANNNAVLKSDDGTYLHCDGSGDFVLTEGNLGEKSGKHSMSVWVRLNKLDSKGGGTITIDTHYAAQKEPSYSHSQFDSIVYNEIANNKKWILGSDHFRRTQTGGSETAESTIGQWIHLVATYNKDTGYAKLYRNGELEQSYEPNGGFITDDLTQARVMFCQRHLRAGGDDLHGDVDLGEIYDYDLSPENVGELFRRGRELSKPTPSASGDPHFVTWTGAKYDFHGGCDLILLQNTGFANGLGMNIHIRTQISTWWSFIESAAIQIGDNTLEIVGGHKGDLASYWLNGGDKMELQTGDASLGDYPVHFKRVNDHHTIARIDLGHGDAISIESFKDFIRVNVHNKSKKSFDGSSGLLGSYPEGNKIGRDGKTLFSDENSFGQEWQVLATEANLFHSAKVQPPNKCVMPEDRKTSTHRRLGESKIGEEEAALACARVSEDSRDACIFDVMATQDMDMAGSY